MPDASTLSRTPRHDEGPPRRVEGVESCPAKGLRLPPGLAADPDDLACSSSAGAGEREQIQGSPDARQGARRGAEGGASSSLVPYRESVGEICPTKPLLVVCDQSPDLRFPASCDRYGCTVCGPRKARQKAALMTWAARHADRCRLVTLTQLPTTDHGALDWQRARAQVRHWMFRVRREYPGWEMGWAIERNPRGTGFHAHGVQHGPFVPQAVLQERWGGRIVDIRALRRPAAGVYAVKEAVRVAGYTVKGGTENFDGLQEHLAINGHRAAHFTRGFLHGLTSREALSAISREQNDGEQRTWHLEPAWETP